MLVKRFLLPLVICCSLLATTQSREMRRDRREAEATFGSLVGDLASPFLNFKRGILNILGGSNGEKKPSKPSNKPSYGAPSYNAPAPTYNAPAPAYHAPAPTYQAPAYHAPAPVYDPPAPVYDPPAPKPEIKILPAPDLSQYAPAPAVDTYGSPVAAPAADTYGSPDPSLVTYSAQVAAPALDSYGSPVIPTYVYEPAAPENPASPPVYEPATYDPAPVDIIPTYTVEIPASPPVYEPATYDPAPVDIIPTYTVEIPEPIAAEPSLSEIVSIRTNANLDQYSVDLTGETKNAAPVVADIIDLKTGEDTNESREPKAFNVEQPIINQVQIVEEKPVENIVIDLTDSLKDIVITTEEGFQTNFFQESEVSNNEDLVIQTDVSAIPPPTQIITFTASEQIPALSAPVQTSDEVISFSLAQNAQFRNVDFTAVQNDAQIDTFIATPAVVNLAQDSAPVFETLLTETIPTETIPTETLPTETIPTETIPTETLPTETIPTETITPIAPNQELKSLVVELDSAPLEIADIEPVDIADVEVIDLRTNKQSSGLTLVDHDEDHPVLLVIVDETTTSAVPITTEPQEIIELLEEEMSVDVEDNSVKSSDEFDQQNEVVIDLTQEEIATTKKPELRRVTFTILGEEEAKNVNPEITFRIVDASNQAETENAETFRILETTTAAVFDEVSIDEIKVSGDIPEVIQSDPVFQEIVKTAEEDDKIKRGYNQYDPRHSQVYAHKYNDKYSNWYYFRKGY